MDKEIRFDQETGLWWEEYGEEKILCIRDHDGEVYRFSNTYPISIDFGEAVNHESDSVTIQMNMTYDRKNQT